MSETYIPLTMCGQAKNQTSEGSPAVSKLFPSAVHNELSARGA